MKKGRKNDEEDKTERKGLQNEIDNMKFITKKMMKQLSVDVNKGIVIYLVNLCQHQINMF